MMAQLEILRESSSVAGQRERQRLLVHPQRLTRVFHVDRIGRSRRSMQSVGLILGMVGFTHSKQDHGDSEIDEAGDQGSDPFGPSEEILGLYLLEVEIDLLEDVFSLEGDHTGLMLELMNWDSEIFFRILLASHFQSKTLGSEPRRTADSSP